MYDYGDAPAKDVVELVIFGPGYGEAIAVHVGDENWLLVDSCLSPSSKLPASIEYLNVVGVPLTNVHTIVASHWHDDHVKGLAHMVKSCPNATLYISGVFDNKEAKAFLSAFGGKAVSTHTAGAKELFNAISVSPKSPCLTNHRTLIWEGKVHGKAMRAVAFSPTPKAGTHSIAHMAQYLPKINDPIKHVVELKPNLEAIVININLGDDSILLGSDLEDHGNLGWTSIVGDSWCLSNQVASLYKISHHGSSTGDHPDIWKKLLKNSPTACLTPFINGSVRLPNADDLKRIVSNAKLAYTSSNGTKRPQIDSNLLKRMAQMAKKVAPISTGFGAIRFRRNINEKDWNVELFGQATQLV